MLSAGKPTRLKGVDLRARGTFRLLIARVLLIQSIPESNFLP
jgi:hypothetical protein